MRKSILFMVGWLLWCAGARAQAPLYLGTKTPYAAPVAQYTAAPPGFKPVFVNYVGRHGARYLTKAGADIKTLQVLEAAEKKQGLTLLGQQVKKMVACLCDIEKGQYENISLLGAKEQQAIGQRLLSRYRSAFAGNGLDVVVTYKVRTRQSADAFLQAYKNYAGEKHFSKKADSLDAVLRFYDLSPAYQQYKKSSLLKKAMDSLEQDARSQAVANNVAARLFTSSFRASWKTEEARAFAENLYDLYAVQFSLQEELRKKGYANNSVKLGIAFSPEDLAWEDFKSGAADFLEKGPGYDSLGIQVKVAAPLLADFVRTMDEATGTTAGNAGARHTGGGGGEDNAAAYHPDAVLRFTHAEAISPFACLLGIPAASTPSAGIYQYHDHWQADNIIPLSANIQWILYANGKEYLVKILLNEKEVLLPITGSEGPYYRWSNLRAYCLQRLQAVQAGLQDDMLQYLKELK